MMGDNRTDKTLKPNFSTGHAKKDVLLTDKDEVKAVFKQETVPEIRDRFKLVYFILLIHGIGVLMQWNMFINAQDYVVKFKLNATLLDGSIDKSTELYRNYFLSFLCFVDQIPNVLFNAVNLFCQFKRGSPAVGIVFSIIGVIVVFILTIVLAVMDSTSWHDQFFWIALVTVVIINGANGVCQNSIYGTAACLPHKYTNAAVLGSVGASSLQKISGLVTSIIAIAVTAATSDIRTSAIYYFLTAIFVLLVAFDSYLASALLRFYRHHFKMASEQKRSLKEDVKSYHTKYLIVITKSWVYLLRVFFIILVALTWFPVTEAGIESSDPSSINSAPSFLPENAKVLVGQKATFTCTVSEDDNVDFLYSPDGREENSTPVYINDSVVDPFDKQGYKVVTVSEGNLIRYLFSIEKVRPQDQGSFFCDIHDRANLRANLVVTAPSFLPENATVLVVQTTTFTYTVSEDDNLVTAVSAGGNLGRLGYHVPYCQCVFGYMIIKLLYTYCTYLF